MFRTIPGQQINQFDPDGSLALLVKRYQQTNVPYRYVQGLAESGFSFISEMHNKGWLLDDFLEDEYSGISSES
jgi:hypothetical protein